MNTHRIVISPELFSAIRQRRKAFVQLKNKSAKAVSEGDFMLATAERTSSGWAEARGALLLTCGIIERQKGGILNVSIKHLCYYTARKKAAEIADRLTK